MTKVSGADRNPRPPPPPLDTARLQELALGYAARFATTRLWLARYLARKLGERGWQGDVPPDIDALVGRLAELGYVDDRAWAAARARGLAARGLGARRVRGDLAAAGIDRDDAAAALASEDDGDPAVHAIVAAIACARRRRLGPFARQPGNDPAQRRRDLAAMARAGHDFDVARRVLAAADPAAAEALAANCGKF